MFIESLARLNFYLKVSKQFCIEKIKIGITITRSFTAQTFSPAGSSGACYIVMQTKQRRYCDVEAALKLAQINVNSVYIHIFMNLLIFCLKY